MKSISAKFGYFEKYIKRLASYPISQKPTSRKLGVTKAVAQMAYREMKEIRFPGATTDYITWVAAMHEIDLIQSMADIDLWEARDDRKFFSMLERKSDIASVVLRGSWFIRLADMERFSPDPATGLSGNLLIGKVVYAMLRACNELEAASKTEIRDKAMHNAELSGCNKLILNILKYQELNPVIDYSLTTSQSTNQQTNQTPATTRAKGHKRPAAGRVR